MQQVQIRVSRIRVKICGITRQQDAQAAAAAGADALGFVFYDSSPRSVSVPLAASIVSRVPAFVSTVGLFVNAERDLVQRAIDDCQLDLLQFHGDESPAYCESFARPYIKALRMREDLDVAEAVKHYGSARAVLLDSYRPGTPGGTGERFDWQRIPVSLPRPLILAGGLNAANVVQGIASCRPWAVDVSGGVEAMPGIKSPEKISEFMQAVAGTANLE